MKLHWRSRRVSLTICSRRGTADTQPGLGGCKAGGKEAALYPAAVTSAQLFYLDSLLLSASANKLYIHSVRLPDREAGQYRLVRTVAVADCKTLTTLAAINQFYSYLALLGCSDRSVRVYDVNQAKVIILQISR